MKKSSSRTSDDFDDFLREEGILDEVRRGALKKVAAYRKKAKSPTPIYLNNEAQALVEKIARQKATDISTVVNALILQDKSLVRAK